MDPDAGSAGKKCRVRAHGAARPTAPGDTEKAPSKPFSATFTACPDRWLPYPSLHQHKIAAS